MKKILLAIGILLLALPAYAAQLTLDTTPDTGNSSTLKKLGDTVNSNFNENYPAIALNTAKTGITAQQTTDITTNNAKVTYPGVVLAVEDEGISEATAVTKLNFIGSGVTAVEVDVHEINITIPGSVGGGISNIVEDTAPQLGGNLDMQTFNIEGVTATIMGFLTGVDEDIQVAIDANTAKVTNATHTGDATGATALTLANAAISGKTVVTAVSTDYVLIGDASDANNLKRALISDFASAGGDMGTATYDPAAIAEQLVGLTAAQTLTFKTLTLPKINGVVDLTSTSTELNLLDGVTVLSGSNTGDEVVATTTTAGIAELAASADVVTGTETDTIVTPDTLTDKMAAPGEIGLTIPGVVNATVFKSPQATAGAHFNIMYEDGTETGANYVGWASPNASSNNLVLIMPNVDPTAGQILACTMEGTQITFSDGVARDAATCSWTTASAETNSLETTITGILANEVFVGSGADAGAFVATDSLTANWHTTGTLKGRMEYGADITASTTHDTSETHNAVYHFTAAATITLDAAADAGYGSVVSYRVRDAAEAAVIDVQAAERINLDGTALVAGTAITATGAGSFVTLVSTTDTDGSGTDGWEVWGNNGFASE